MNGKVVNIPSAQLMGRRCDQHSRKGEEAGCVSRVQWRLQARSACPSGVDVDTKKMTGVLKSLPDREDILPDINENLVVELYSK